MVFRTPLMVFRRTKMEKMCVKLLYVAALCMLIASTATGEKLLPKARTHFRRFMEDFGRQYADDNETRMRFEIFKRNLQTIDELNAANTNAVFEITKFADLTDEEKHRFTSFAPNISRQSSYPTINCEQIDGSELNISRKEVPESWDWRDHVAVTEVKNQGNCGSCWTFSTTGNLEGQYAIKNGKLLEFSEQQLLDCDQRTEPMDCEHGWDMVEAMKYYISTGAMSENDYSYEEAIGQCRYDKSKVKTTVKGCIQYKPQSEEALKEILYTQGPLSIAIHGDRLFNYRSGILQDCKNTDIDHGVLLVGYGTENGIPYWIAKNSWGTRFGEKGYFRMERGTNQCGMMNPDDGEIASAVL